eukprot:g343.t1
MASLLKGEESIVRWGIIGCGSVCEVKSGPGFYKCKNSKLVAVCRRNEEKGKDFAKRHNVPKYYSTADEILNDKEVNAIYISTPPSTHHEIAMKCLAKNLPTYIEKPLGRNYSETLDIVNKFKMKNVPLFVAYYRRGQDKFIEARKRIQSGEIGTITSVSYVMLRPQKPMFTTGKVSKTKNNLPWRYVAKESGGGLIMDVGCHTLDIIDFMCGEITNVNGIASRIDNANNKSETNNKYYYDVEDQVSLSGTFKNGALLNCLWCFVGAPGVYDDTITIRGTKGKMSLSTFQPTTLDITKVTTGEKIQLDLPPPEHAQQPLIQSICNCLTGERNLKDVVNISTGENALRCALILDKALENYYGNRNNGFWNNKSLWPGLLTAGTKSGTPTVTSFPIRQAFVMSVNEGQREEYERRHRPIWPELEAVLKEHGVLTYSIFYLKSTNQLFAYAEIEDLDRWSSVAKTEVCQKWWKYMGDIMPSNEDHSPVAETLEEVFHIS